MPDPNRLTIPMFDPAALEQESLDPLIRPTTKADVRDRLRQRRQAAPALPVPARSAPTAAGDPSDKQYEHLRELSRNDFVTVHEAFDRVSQQHVAIHELNPRMRADDNARTLFWQQAFYQAHVRHPHLMVIHTVNRERHWIVTELCERSLADDLAKGPLPVERVETLLVNVLSALAALHAQGLVHADLSPEALLVDSHGNVKLARSAGPDFVGSVSRGRRSGKYLAPELVLPAEFGPIGFATDLYSLAVIMLELLAGPRFESFFKGIDETEKLGDEAWARWHASPTERLPDVEILFPSLSRGVGKVLNAMLEKHVANRAPSATEAMRLLQEHDTNLPAVITPVSPTMAGGATDIVTIGETSPVAGPLGRVPTPAAATPPANASKWKSLTPQLMYGLVGVNCFFTFLLLAGGQSPAPSQPTVAELSANLDGELTPRAVSTTQSTKSERGKALDEFDTDKPAPPVEPPASTSTVWVEPKSLDLADIKPKRVTVGFQSDPPGATILVDGQVVGKSPSDVELEPGNHDIVFDRPGYQPHHLNVSLELGKGRVMKASLLLEPAPARYQPAFYATRSRRDLLPSTLKTLTAHDARNLSVYSVTRLKQWSDEVHKRDLDCRIPHALALIFTERRMYSDALACLELAERAAPADYLLPLRRKVWIKLVQQKDQDVAAGCAALIEKATTLRHARPESAEREALDTLVADSLYYVGRVMALVEAVSSESSPRIGSWHSREKAWVALLTSSEQEMYYRAKRFQADTLDAEWPTLTDPVARLAYLERVLGEDVATERKLLLDSVKPTHYQSVSYTWPNK